MLNRYLHVLSAVSLVAFVLYSFAPRIIHYRDANRCLRALVSSTSWDHATPYDLKCEDVDLFRAYRSTIEHLSTSLTNAQQNLEELPADACPWMGFSDTKPGTENPPYEMGASDGRVQVPMGDHMDSVKTRHEQLNTEIKTLINERDHVIRKVRAQVDSHWRFSTVVTNTQLLANLLLMAAFYIWRAVFPRTPAQVRPSRVHAQPPQNRVFIKIEDDD